MKTNKTYRALLDKSISSMIAAIEIYNKPDFDYREETFAILAVNSWEMLLKAVMFKINKYNLHSIYELKPKIKKDGTKSKIKEVSLSRCGNKKTLGIYPAMNYLAKKSILSDSIKSNIEALIELRDNSIHFINIDSISKPVQELGFATIRNYMNFIKEHNIEIDLTDYNFYLMPLAYVDKKIDFKSISTEETTRYIEYVKDLMTTKEDDDYDIAISIDVNFNKASTLEAIPVRFSKEGMPIYLSDDAMRIRFPLTYKEVVTKCKERYSNFKQNNDFNDHMKVVKHNPHLAHERKLDEKNPKSAKTTFYSTNIWQELDKNYQKRYYSSNSVSSAIES